MSNLVLNLKENYFNINNNNNFLTIEKNSNLNFNKEIQTSYEEKIINNKINKKLINFSKIIEKKKKKKKKKRN